jgi:hypothetical protein
MPPHFHEAAMEAITEAIRETGGEAGELRKVLSRRLGSSKPEVSRELSSRVEREELARITFGKRSFYVLPGAITAALAAEPEPAPYSPPLYDPDAPLSLSTASIRFLEPFDPAVSLTSPDQHVHGYVAFEHGCGKLLVSSGFYAHHGLLADLSRPFEVNGVRMVIAW